MEHIGENSLWIKYFVIVEICCSICHYVRVEKNMKCFCLQLKRIQVNVGNGPKSFVGPTIVKQIKHNLYDHHQLDNKKSVLKIVHRNRILHTLIGFPIRCNNRTSVMKFFMNYPEKAVKFTIMSSEQCSLSTCIFNNRMIMKKRILSDHF